MNNLFEDERLLPFLIITIATIILYFIFDWPWLLFICGASAIRTYQLWPEKKEETQDDDND